MRPKIKPSKKFQFDKPGRLDKKYQNLSISKSKNSRNHSNILKKIYIVVLSALIIVFCISSYYLYIINNKFEASLTDRISLLEGEKCSEYKKSNVYTFLDIEFHDNAVKSTNLRLFSNGIRYKINFDEFTFSIDSGGTKGTVADLIRSNSYFVNKDRIFQNLKNWFYRDFKIKVDGIFVTNENNTLEKYSQYYKYNIIQRFEFDYDKLNSINIKSDLCAESVNELISDYFINSSNREKSIKFNNNLQIKDLFIFDDIKKEQVRIQISNATGVGNWGDLIESIFTSYGLNVVKVDFQNEVIDKTSISIDKESLKNSVTISQVQYLLLSERSGEMKVEESLFADVYITLGVDSLVN